MCVCVCVCVYIYIYIYVCVCVCVCVCTEETLKFLESTKECKTLTFVIAYLIAQANYELSSDDWWSLFK